VGHQGSVVKYIVALCSAREGIFSFSTPIRRLGRGQKTRYHARLTVRARKVESRHGGAEVTGLCDAIQLRDGQFFALNFTVLGLASRHPNPVPSVATENPHERKRKSQGTAGN
jgi:hypothetical protein